jgi:exodeoxyribonuclease VII large subunit
MTADFFDFKRQMQRPAKKPSAAQSKDAGDKAITVSQLTDRIKRVITTGMAGPLLVKGEVSNFKPNRASGHVYFTLKDSNACIDCVMWRSDAERLKFDVEEGMEVLAGGTIDVYPPRGKYQMYVTSLRPLGQGALELALRQMRAKLEAEGLFAPERKKPLPAYPRRIVIITSREAAALQDVLKVLRRFPWLDLMVYSAPVQGEGAAGKIAAAISHVNAKIVSVGGCDLIILGRGGGSLEDLWSFNEEVVARAIAASRIPIITGIGHEVDVSIADLVADYHAHTPTEAAQVVTAKWRAAAELLAAGHQRLKRSLGIVIQNRRQRLALVERHEAMRRPADRLRVLRQYLDDRQRTLLVAEQRLLRRLTDRVAAAELHTARRLPAIVHGLAQRISDRATMLQRAMLSRFRRLDDRIGQLNLRLQRQHPAQLTQLANQRLKVSASHLEAAMTRRLAALDTQVQSAGRQLKAVSPAAVLKRGYSITTRKKGGDVIRSATDVKAGDKLLTRFIDGQVESVAEDQQQMSLFD